MPVQSWLLGIRFLLPALGETLKMTLGIAPLVLAVGIIFSLFQKLNNRLLNVIAYVFVEFFRGTPLIGQLFIGYYVLPFLKVKLPANLVGTIVLSLNSGAYCAEIFRAGVDSVDIAQWEAGRVLNLSDIFIFFRIVLPQSLRVSLPSIGNLVIEVFRLTSALALLGVVELTAKGRALSSSTNRPFIAWTLVFLFYFVVSYPASRLMEVVERRITIERE